MHQDDEVVLGGRTEFEDIFADITRLRKEIIDIRKNIDSQDAEIDIETDDAVDSLDKLEKEIKETEKSGKSLREDQDKLNKSFADVALSVKAFLGALIVEKIAEFSASIVKTSGDVQEFKTTLDGLFGETRGREIFIELKQLSDDLGISFAAVREEAVEFTFAFEKAGFSADTTRAILDAALISVRAMGGGVNEVTGILSGFAESLEDGVIKAEDLEEELGSNLPAVLDLLAEKLGVTTEELTKMLNEGELLAKETLPLLAEVLLETFGDTAVKQVEGFNAELERTKNQIEDAAIEVGEGFLPELQKLLKEFNRLGKEGESTFRSIGEGIGSTINLLGTFVSLVGDVNNAVKELGRDDSLDTLDNSFANVGKTVLETIVSVEEFFLAIDGRAGESTDEIDLLNDLILTLDVNFGNVASTVEALGDTSEEVLKNRIKANLEVLTDSVSSVILKLDVAKEKFDTLASGLIEDIDVLVEKEDALSAPLRKAVEELQKLRDLAKEIRDAGGVVSAEDVETVRELEAAIEKLVKDALLDAKEGANELRDIFGGLLQDLKDAGDPGDIDLPGVQGLEEAAAGVDDIRKRIAELEAQIAKQEADPFSAFDSTAARAEIFSLQDALENLGPAANAAIPSQGFTDAGEAIRDTATAFDEAQPKISGALRELVEDSDRFRRGFADLSEEQKINVQAQIDLIAQLADQGQASAQDLERFFAAAANEFSKGGEDAKAFSSEIREAFDSTAGVTDPLADGLDRIRDASDQAREAATGTADAVDKIADAGERLAAVGAQDPSFGLGGLGEAAQTAQDAVAPAAEALDKISTAITAIQEGGPVAAESLNLLLTGLAEAVEEETFILSVEGLESLAEAIEKAAEGFTITNEELEEFVEGSEDTVKATEDLGKALDLLSSEERTEKIKALLLVLSDLVKKLIESKREINETGEEAEGAKNSFEGLKEEVSKLVGEIRDELVPVLRDDLNPELETTNENLIAVKDEALLVLDALEKISETAPDLREVAFAILEIFAALEKALPLARDLEAALDGIELP